MVGRGVLCERVENEANGEKANSDEDPGIAVGVVARSAGAWENEKVVCACSGKTVWEEREEMKSRGML